ncbi:MAG: CPBP family glutamic-type intramembrane protease [Gemmatimonadales bacterium]
MSPKPARQLLAFYLLAFAIPAAIMAAALGLRLPDVQGGLIAFLARESAAPNLVTIARYALEEPTAWLILVFAAAPSLAAIAVSGAIGGFAGVRSLLRRLAPAGPAPLRGGVARAYLVILGGSAAVVGWYLWWGARVGTDPVVAGSREALGGTPLGIAAALAIGHLIDEGGTLEELGWRGFALPRLLEILGSPIGASLALGLGWWAWHLPRELPTVLAGGLSAGFAGGQLWFLALCVALSLLSTWGYLATGGSALPGVLIHGGSNLWSKALGATVNPWAGTDVRTVVVILLALPATWWLIARGGRLARAGPG